MTLVHDIGASIALAGPAAPEPLWKYVYAGKPKPFFHPVRTPAGHALSNFEPHDHVWHRGLWFTFKFVNGENFWEERPPFGTQRTLAPPVIAHRGDRIELRGPLQWIRPDGQSPIIDERRLWAYQPLGDDAYAIDLDTELTPLADVLLDRTPFGTWGGYGGLVLRGTRNWQATRILLSDGTRTERPTGQRALWADLSGKLDGGPDRRGGFAILDHPANARHPSPWYGGCADTNYVNAAILFHEPMRLDRGQTLRLRYRVLVHDGEPETTWLDDQWRRFAGD
jgi:hypothetical protein